MRFGPEIYKMANDNNSPGNASALLKEFCNQIKTGSDEVVLEALETLDFLKSQGVQFTPYVMATLRDALNNPNPAVVNRTIRVIETEGVAAFEIDGMREAFMLLTEHKSPNIVFFAIGVLTPCPGEDITNLIKKIADDPETHHKVKRGALISLERRAALLNIPVTGDHSLGGGPVGT